MKFKLLESEQEYEAILDWIDKQFDSKPTPNSQESETLQTALLLVKAYEDEHYPISI